MTKPLQICEVAPRDGLQSASQVLSVDERVAFVGRLVASGLTKIEVGSLVNPSLVPAMADSDVVYQNLVAKFPQNAANFSLLVPNQRGMDRAIEIGCQSVAFFSATSETFNKKNINRSVAESIVEVQHLLQSARQLKMHVRLYISTVFDCAYEGTMDPLADLAPFLPLMAQVDEVSLGDTTGRATLVQVAALAVSPIVTMHSEKIWWHFHDTFQLAGENTEFCLKQGFRQFDSSAGGIGGCPFSPGAKGNIATEKVLSLAEKLGIAHSVQLPLATVG